jgi:hypothetical protein
MDAKHPSSQRKNKEGESENKFLRRILGPKGYEVTTTWRKLHSEELHNVCYSPNIIRDQMKKEGIEKYV